jgi:hypothetical protein
MVVNISMEVHKIFSIYVGEMLWTKSEAANKVIWHEIQPVKRLYLTG